jgi:hypothetical protein
MTTVVKEINKYVSKLSEEEQQLLAAALKKQIIIAEAERLSSFTVRKKIPVTEIVKEIHITRKKRHAAKRRA